MATILCGIDDSAGAVEALRVARDLSADLHLRLVLAHVAAGQGMAEAEGLSTINARKGATRLLEKTAREQTVDPSTDRRVEIGEPAEALSRIAAEENASMIVVGSRRQGRKRRKLLSGVAGDLAGIAPCPVFVVPPPAAK